MADNYCVSFRIANKTVNGRSYEDRYKELVNAMHEGLGYWEDTTSFFLVESSLNTPAIAKKGAGALSAVDDMLFVFDPKDMSACYFGNVAHLDVLKSFFPKLQKVT